MHVTEHLAKAKDTLVSFEVLPPLKGRTISYIYEHLDPLMEFKPLSSPDIALQQTIKHDRKKA